MKKKIIFDAILNIVASTLPIIILQLILLPIVANQVGDKHYGQIITLVSLFTLFSHPFGNVLNNIRLLKNNDYKEKGITGDFNILLLTSLVISSFIMTLGTIYYEGGVYPLSIILIVIISCLRLGREYLIVTFRITLNYVAILLNNIILSLGYIFGVFLFHITGYWQMIFICGLFFSLVYIIKNSNLLKEGFSITPLFKETTYNSFILFISSLMRTALSYADKLLLFPLLGPTAVSIYYSATIIGKIISMGITPLSSVMLSYLARMKEMSIKRFIYIISFTSIFGVLGYFASILISFPLLNLLYPEWAQESMELVYITSATAIISVISSVVHPIILRFNNINWQTIISGTNLFIYMISSIIFYNMYGLMGFCIGILVANIIRLIMMILIFVFNYNKEKAF